MSATSSGAGPSSSGTAPSSSLPPNNQLCLAASKGECDIIRELVKDGVKFDPDENGRTALHYAANYGKTVALKLCLQLGCELDLQDKNGCTALHRAVLDGQVDTVKVLLYEGGAVDRQDENGNTALHEAAWAGYSKIIDLLIKRGKAHVHVSNKHGHKPIHLACQNGHNESTRLLLRAGSNPNTKNNNGDTPLHVSSLFGHITCTRVLLSAGSNVNIKNKDGNTPLHVSAGLGKQKISKILLEAKCDTNLRNNNNITAVEMARRNNHAETVLMILSTHRLWRGNTSRHKPRKNKSSKEDTKDDDTKKKKDKDDGEDEADHAGPAPRVKGRKEIKEEEKLKREEVRRRTEERMLMEENYDKWRELQGNLLRQELRKQAEIHAHRHGKSLTTSHSDCKACMQKLENQIEASKEKMLFELETAKARFEHKLHKMDRKMMHQAACMDRLCQERIKAEATECLHRIDKRAIEERAAWAEENDARLDLVKDDLRGWVEERLHNVQKQLKMINEREKQIGVGLRVRSKSESDLGHADSMDETEITDTDGEDIQGIVIGRGKGENREEEIIDGDEVKSVEELLPEEYDENKAESIQGGTPQRMRPLMRGRNVWTGKYGRSQETIGRSQSLDRELAFATDVMDCRHNNLENSTDEEHSHKNSDRQSDFKVPMYGSIPDHSKVGGQQEAAAERGRSTSRTSHSKRTSSFTRAVQHEMWAAANQSNNDSDGSGRAMVEATYRPPIVTVNKPHRIGSYAPDGIVPANLSSAESDSETDTLSLTTSEDSLVTVSHLTIDSSSCTLTSNQHGATAPVISNTSHFHTPNLQQNSRQPASGQSESSPNTSQSSSPGGAAVLKVNSDCSKSSSGISSAASAALSQHGDPMNDIVVRASALESRAQNRWEHRHRPTSTMDVPPQGEFASSQYSTFHGPQQYVTSRSAYSAQQQQKHQGSDQQQRYPTLRQTAVVQPPAFTSSKPSVAGGATVTSDGAISGGAAYAPRNSPSASQKAHRTDKTQTSGQLPQEQQPVVRGFTAPPKYVARNQQDQKSQQALANQQQTIRIVTPHTYHGKDHQLEQKESTVPTQQQQQDARSRGPMQQFAWNRLGASQRQDHSVISRQLQSTNPVMSNLSNATILKAASHSTSSHPALPHPSVPLTTSDHIPPKQQQKLGILKRPQSAPHHCHQEAHHTNNNSNSQRSGRNAPLSAQVNKKSTATAYPVVPAKPDIDRYGHRSGKPAVLAKSDVNGNSSGSSRAVPQQQHHQTLKTPQMVMATSGNVNPASMTQFTTPEERPLSSQMIQSAGMIAQSRIKDGKPGSLQRPLVRRTYEISL